MTPGLVGARGDRHSDAVNHRAFFGLVLTAPWLLGCGLVLDLAPPDPDAGGMDASTQGDAGAPECGADSDCLAASACVADGRCAQGVCVPGLALSCDDGIECTVDSCDPALGCRYEADHGACEEGSECAPGVCDPGAGCLYAPDHTLCDDALPCTADACGEDGTCEHELTDAICERIIGVGSHCLGDGQCSDIECGADSDCPTDVPCRSLIGCETGLCAYDLAAEGASCNDRDGCTPSSVCALGVCTPDAPPRRCSDDNDCTTDTCVPSADDTYACFHGDLADGASCDDGRPCTGMGRCLGGECGTGAPICVDVAGDCQTTSCVASSSGVTCANVSPCGNNTTCASDTCACAAGFTDCNGDGHCTCATTTSECTLGVCVPKIVLDGAVLCPLDREDCDRDGICECDVRMGSCDRTTGICINGARDAGVRDGAVSGCAIGRDDCDGNGTCECPTVCVAGAGGGLNCPI